MSVYISVHECFQFLLGRHDHDGGSLRREDMIEGGRGEGDLQLFIHTLNNVYS